LKNKQQNYYSCANLTIKPDSHDLFGPQGAKIILTEQSEEAEDHESEIDLVEETKKKIQELQDLENIEDDEDDDLMIDHLKQSLAKKREYQKEDLDDFAVEIDKKDNILSERVKKLKTLKAAQQAAKAKLTESSRYSSAIST